jgi:hypothetical protein
MLVNGIQQLLRSLQIPQHAPRSNQCSLATSQLHIAAIATALLPSSCALSGKARAEAARLKIVHVKAAAKVQASYTKFNTMVAVSRRASAGSHSFWLISWIYFLIRRDPSIFRGTTLCEKICTGF